MLPIKEHWKLNKHEISSIRSITVEQILADLYTSIKEALLQLPKLLIHNYTKTRTLIMTIYHTEEISIETPRIIFFDWLKSLIRVYGEHQYNYKLMLLFNSSLGVKLVMSDTMDEISKLVNEQIQMSVICRLQN